MRGSFHGIGRVKQDGIECDECMLVVRDDVTAFLPFKRTTVLLKGVCVCTLNVFFPDEILARVYEAFKFFVKKTA